MKIVFAALNAKYVHSNLAVYDIEAYSRKKWIEEHGSFEGLELKIMEYTINHNLDRIMQSLFEQKPDMIAFSCYIWNISEILTICKEIKKVAPNLLIWLGGPEVSYNSEKMLSDGKFIDGIICGEGEATVYELINYYMGLSDSLETINGITYRKEEGTIYQNPPRNLLSLDEIPFIYKDLSVFENKILYYESSRGCPFSCSYCLSSIDKSVRFRNLSLVKNEISFFMDNKVKQVKFIDRTFNCDKKRAREIWNYILENDNGITNYHFEIAADLIEDEDLQIFSKMRPGLIQLEIGLQSTNMDTIKEIRRVTDIKKLKSNMLAIRKLKNIHRHLDLIAGLPFEDYQSFVRSFNDAYSMKPDQLQLGFLKVLKGSYMEEQIKEYELLYRDEQPYEVLSTKWISYEEILKLKRVEEMVEVYYNSDQFEHVIPYVETFFESAYDMYDSIACYYDEHDSYGMGYKREARYEMLRNFFMDCINEGKMTGVSNKEDCTLIFDSLLTFDYYLRENAKTRPSWRKELPIDKERYNNFFKCGGNDELSLEKDGYDSKSAARSMHIEPVCEKALKWIDESGYNTDNVSDNGILYVVYDYSKRNPLSGDAGYTIISHL